MRVLYIPDVGEYGGATESFLGMVDMLAPKVSVIVPIYNVEPYFKQCVDSIRSQTMKELEIILVDDGSQDRCPKMCDQFAAEDDRIRVVHQENQGVSAARNEGIELSSADWIMFVDPDDWLENNAVEVLYETAVRTEDDIVCASFYYEYSSGQRIVSVNDCKEWITHDELSTLFENIVGYQKQQNKSAFGYPWGKLYKKVFLTEHKIGFISGLKRRQDTVFNLYAAYFARKIFVLDAAIYHYRIHNTSACKKLFSNQQDIYQEIHSEMYTFMKKFNLWTEFQDSYNYVVLCSVFELSTLYGKNVVTVSDLIIKALLLNDFCGKADCRKAIRDTELTSMPSKKQKLSLWLLKHHMYRTTILIRYLYGKLFPYK